MRIPINLSSQPFRRDRALILSSGLIAVVLLVTLGMLTQLARLDMQNKMESSRQLAIAQSQLNTVLREQSTINRELAQPQNAAVLERSVLLNEMLMRKGISWTRIFSDLEKTLPPDVRVLQIRPQLDSKNRIFLQMVIGADSTGQLNGFLQKLESSEVFGATMVTSIVPPSQTDPLYRYQVSVSYAQKI